jgi:hypothetical protein
MPSAASLLKDNLTGQDATPPNRGPLQYSFAVNAGRMRMLTTIREWNQKRTLRTMLNDPRSARGFRSAGQLEKGIGADRSTTERLLLSIGARKAQGAEEWTLKPL